MLLPILLFAAVVLAFIAWRAPDRRVRTAVVAGITLAVPMLLLGGYWYAKNVVVFGNPMWPFTVGPFVGYGRIEDLIVQNPPGLAGMDRVRQIATSWLGDLQLARYGYDTRIGGFGLAWLLIIGLAAAGLATRLAGRWIVPILGIVLPSVLTLLVMPMPWWPRLTTFAFVACAGLAAVALTRMHPRVGQVAALIVASAGLASLYSANATANAELVTGDGGRAGVSAELRLVRAGEATRQIWDPGRNVDHSNSCHLAPGSKWIRFNLPHCTACRAEARSGAPATVRRAGRSGSRRVEPPRDGRRISS